MNPAVAARTDAAPVYCVLADSDVDVALESWRRQLPEGSQVQALPRSARALRELAAANPGRDAVLIDYRAVLPPYWQPRLLAAVAASPATGVICALDAAALNLPCKVPSEVADARCWAVSEHECVPTRALGRGLSYWRAAALAAIGAEEAALAVPFGIEAAWLDHLCVGGAPSPAATGDGAALSALRARIETLGDVVPPWIGLDGRPVVLHVLHGWGGGAQRFVADLAKADMQRHHLVLIARSLPERHLTGVSLDLHLDPDSPPLRSFPFDAPVEASVESSPEARSALHRVLRDYSVAQIVVSSLIGHSLDALRTGLPTVIACHDYYPLWPALHDAFDDADKDFSPDALAAPLAKDRLFKPHGGSFTETRADAWRKLREAYVAALLQAKAPLVAPSHGVLRNLARIEPRLASLPAHVIPHGLAPWPGPVPAWQPPARDGLRVLIAGRINDAKGSELLDALLPQLDPRIELVLVGCGAAGMNYFGRPRVHVLLDYRREELPSLVARFAPDLALLPSTVPETYSYMLSELWSLRVPVLSPRLGALAERIEDGVTGLLAAPDAKAIAERLNGLLHDRSTLERLRAATPHVATLESMGQAWSEVLVATAPAATRATSAGALPVDAVASARRHQQETEIHDLRQRISTAQAKLDQQLEELERRAVWAASLEQRLEERTRWAIRMDADLAERDARLTALQQEFDERTAWALSMQEELMQLHGEITRLAEQNARLAENNAQLVDATRQRDELQRHLEAVIVQRDAFEAERNRILQSRSWKLTRPLRYIARKASGLRQRLAFRWQRLASILRRTLASLKTRGLAGTLTRIRRELAPPPVSSAPLVVPDASDAPIVLPRSETPKVSVVIPVYNHLDATLTCLRSLAATKNDVALEIIVVDDCSSDDTAQRLPCIEGLRYQRNAQNLGFIGACNAGAAAARGEFVAFLNNDTAVQDHWLDALLDTFAQHENVGLVGAKLVYPDGRLQEAGGIVFSDGSGWNYGRFDDPAKPEYNFVREVDYCSGAAIVLRLELFRTFGGFDPHYAPAYYEDTDLAMKVRQAGLRVLYQPAAVVIHYEGISSGTDITTGTKRFQAINQIKFLERWRDALETHAPPGTDIAIARQHRSRKHVLVVDATTPQPDQDSGSLRLSNILQLLLQDNCAVSFFADNRAYVERYSRQLQQMGVEVLWHPWLSDPVAWFAENGKRLSVVFVSRHYIASHYVDLVRRHAPQAKLVFDTVDLHYLREQRAAALANDEALARTAAVTREAELALVRECDLTLVVSPVEKELLERELPGARVAILSNVHAVPGRRRGYAEREGLMFVGGYQHPPNVDAATWFAREILPLVRRELPDVQFHLIGSKAPAEVRALGELPGVVFHGYVEDIEPFLDGCRVAVAPLRYGAGVKGKVNMSMSYGQPVVATPVAVEGMFAQAGRDVLVATDATEFAAQTIAAYRDEALWNTLSDHGAANVREHFSFETARAALRSIVG